MSESDRIKQIRERCEKASEGPWTGKIWKRKEFDGSNTWGSFECNRQEDYEFLEHSRSDIPFLLSLLEKSEAENKRLKDKLTLIWDYCELGLPLFLHSNRFEHLKKLVADFEMKSPQGDLP